MREGDRVQELDLNKRVVRVEIEINIDHDIEDDDEAENDEVRPYTLNFANHVDRGQGNNHF